MNLIHVRSQTGSALITGMIAALSVGVVSAIIMQQSQITEKQTRAPRVKSAMIQVETQVRTLAFEPSVYDVCPPGSPAGCEVVLDTSSFSSLSKEIPGAKCPGTGFCGVEVTNPVFVPATGAFTADVVYTGQEVSMAPIRVTASVPTAVWKSDGVAGCSEASPIFMGVDMDGNPLCQTLPANCGHGSYLNSLDPMRLTTTSAASCRPLPPSVSCPAGQYLYAVNWSADLSSIQFSCAPQKSPFQVASIGADPTSYTYSGDPTYSVNPYPTPATTPTPGNLCYGIDPGETSQHGNNVYVPVECEDAGTCTTLGAKLTTKCSIIMPDGSAGGPASNWQLTCLNPGGNSAGSVGGCANTMGGPICANPTTSPFSIVSYNACTNSSGTTISGGSAHPNPSTGTYCTGWISPMTSPHGANFSGDNNISVRILWQSTIYTCTYYGYLGTSSSGQVSGSASPALPPGITCSSMNFFATSQGWGGGLNILGPGPQYAPCP